MSSAFSRRPLGRSGIAVSPLGVGTNRWMHGRNDEAVSRAFAASLDAGTDFFDTAEVYGFGRSERLLGACLRQDGRPAVVASKFAPYPTRLSRGQFLRAVDRSLSRLGVQTIDLYYVHFPFTLLGVERLMDLMAQAVEAGKIRAVGVSNFSAGQMRRAAAHLSQYQIPLAANEVHYSVLHRKPEVNGVLEACRELDVALVAYRPLAGGRLMAGARPGPAAASRGKHETAGKDPQVLLQTLAGIAQRHGCSAGQVALNWLLRRDDHVIPIPGATKAGHAQENAGALGWQLTDEEFAAIDQASAPRRQ
jgi:aryl-alcohol dehydrogenase-like predicted oxidoreductase